MQKLVYNKPKNFIILFNPQGDLETKIEDVSMVEPEGMCFVVKKVIGNDPRPGTVLMVPISNTNLYIER